MIRWAIACMVWLSCAGPDAEPDYTCDLGSTSAALQAVDRSLIGQARRYDADGMLREREPELRNSSAARRAVGWHTAAKVLAPVTLQTLPGAPDAQLPLWQTWYGRDDIHRMFGRLYDQLGQSRRARRDRFDEVELDESFAWNADSVEDLDNWPEQRQQAYAAAIETAEQVAGLGGIAAVGYSPSAARHLMGSYPDILECMEHGAPDAVAEGSSPAQRRLTREPIAIGSCQSKAFGPFFVADGHSLAAELSGRDANATIVLRSGERSVACTAAEACSIDGPGAVTVEVGADARGANAMLSVDYMDPDPAWSACLASAFGLDVAVVKASWHRADFERALPTYDTSADALARRLDPEGPADWELPDGEADPGPNDIYTLKLANGNTYRLAALHIMTKELDHWLWITLWWSPDPNHDFGEDRPPEIDALGGPWANYKMCVATAFVDGDESFDATSSLGRALAATHTDSVSWCSNPYLERGHGNANTNCIGCHQHAGSGLAPEQILDDPAFPQRGRTQVRNNFPTDYSYTVHAGDRLGRMFADTAEHYDSSD